MIPLSKAVGIFLMNVNLSGSALNTTSNPKDGRMPVDDAFNEPDPMLEPVDWAEYRETDDLFRDALRRLVRVRAGEERREVYNTKSYITAKIAWKNDVDFVIESLADAGDHLTDEEYEQRFADGIRNQRSIPSSENESEGFADIE